MPEQSDTPAAPSAASPATPETIARQVMSDALGVPFGECSADSMGAQMIREGIKRFAAVPRLYSDADRERAIARLKGRDGLHGSTVEYYIGECVDLVAEALGMRRAGA